MHCKELFDLISSLQREIFVKIVSSDLDQSEGQSEAVILLIFSLKLISIFTPNPNPSDVY